MTNFNYKPMYATRKATESHIYAINEELEALGNVPGDVISYTHTRKIMDHLRELRTRMYVDLEYFDAIDRAMEEAVR